MGEERGQRVAGRRQVIPEQTRGIFLREQEECSRKLLVLHSLLAPK